MSWFRSLLTQPSPDGRRLQGLTSAGLALVLLLGVLATQQPAVQQPDSELVLTPPPPVAVVTAAPKPRKAAPQARAATAARRTTPTRPQRRRVAAPAVAKPAAPVQPPAGPAHVRMVRRYERDAHGEGLCPAGTESAPLGLTCRAAQVASAPGGYVVRFKVCPTSAARFELRFPSEAEVAMTVLDDAGQAVWTWRPPRPFRDAPHVLQSEVGACWAWQTPWTQVDDRGRPLPDAAYELQVDFLEVEDDATYTQRFFADRA